MTGLLVDPRDEVMNAHHRGQALERRTVQRKRVRKSAVGKECIRHEQLSPRGILGLVLERGQRFLGDRVVCMAEGMPGAGDLRRDLRDPAQLRDHVGCTSGGCKGLGQHPPALDVVGSGRHDSLEGSNGLRHVAACEITGAKEQVGREQLGVEGDGTLQRRDGLCLPPGHRERHSQVHQQPGLVRKRFEQLLVHARGLVEPAVLHRRGGRAAPAGDLWRLRPRRDGERCRQEED